MKKFHIAGTAAAISAAPGATRAPPAAALSITSYCAALFSVGMSTCGIRHESCIKFIEGSAIGRRAHSAVRRCCRDSAKVSPAKLETLSDLPAPSRSARRVSPFFLRVLFPFDLISLRGVRRSCLAPLAEARIRIALSNFSVKMFVHLVNGQKFIYSDVPRTYRGTRRYYR
ncbi:hypothetical protein EVAR_40784_1 [Eumeta japonica]|uniref:Uncharacterized protein n=1 Tax=Eumeta variegata TaxID=151549 RepID=A0A4C1X6Q9_EUMVA|nr:hypothetical protein EVAR_40784_1 [Eumeta japonica]